VTYLSSNFDALDRKILRCYLKGSQQTPEVPPLKTDRPFQGITTTLVSKSIPASPTQWVAQHRDRRSPAREGRLRHALSLCQL
jgi:hypothetical protein